MNETIKVLTTRRSVRKFKSDSVPEKVLDEILTAGMYAPTGMGQQSPIIIVITDPEVRAEVSELNAEIAGMSGDPFYGAPVILLVAAKKRPTDVYDGTCVISNLMNAAWSLGVGSCWIHRAKEELEGEWGKKLLAKLGIEGEYVGVGHVALGYPDGEIAAPKPRKSDWVYRI